MKFTLQELVLILIFLSIFIFDPSLAVQAILNTTTFLWNIVPAYNVYKIPSPFHLLISLTSSYWYKVSLPYISVFICCLHSSLNFSSHHELFDYLLFSITCLCLTFLWNYCSWLLNIYNSSWSLYINSLHINTIGKKVCHYKLFALASLIIKWIVILLKEFTNRERWQSFFFQLHTDTFTTYVKETISLFWTISN